MPNPQIFNQQNSDQEKSFNVIRSESKSSHEKQKQLNSKYLYQSNIKLMSPFANYIFQMKDFSTPIQIAQFSESKIFKNDELHEQSSPLMLIEFSQKIAQKQNEQSEDSQNNSFQSNHQIQEDMIIDLMGNRICEFNTGFQNQYSDDQNDLPPILQDKQNDFSHNLRTPLKIRPSEARSPLQDITPSMTNKKKSGQQIGTKTNKKNKTSNKTATKRCQMQKWGLLTPRTMAESRLSKVGRGNNEKLKIERF